MNLARTLLASVLAAVVWAAGTFGDGPAPSTQQPPAKSTDHKSDTLGVDWTPEAILAHIKLVEESKDLKPDDRKKIVELYKQAQANLKAEADWKAKSAAHAKATSEAPKRLEKLRKELASPAQQVLVPQTATSTDVDADLAQARAHLIDHSRQMEEANAEPERRAERRKKLPEDRLEARRKLEELRKLPPAAISGEPGEALSARLAVHQTRERSLKAENDCYIKELLKYDTTMEIVSLERDLRVREMAHLRKRVEILREALNQMRRKEAEIAAEKAKRTEREQAAAHPVLAELARENQKLAGLRSGERSVVADIDRTDKLLDSARKELSKLKADRKTAEEKVKRTGLNLATGQVLRQEHNKLVQIQRRHVDAAKRRQQITSASARNFDYEGERTTLADVDAKIQETVARLNAPQAQRPAMEAVVTELLNTRKKLLDDLIHDYDLLLGKLLDWDNIEKQILTESRDFGEYVAKNLLWIRSTSTLDSQEFRQAATAIPEILSPTAWWSVVETLWSDVRSNSRTTGFVVLAWCAILVVMQRMRLRLRHLGEKVEASYLTTFWLTVRAVLLTLVIAAFGPLLFAYVGWRLASAESAPFANAVGAAFLGVATLYLGLEMLRSICRRRGLAEAHFRWRVASTTAARRYIYWLLPVALPCAFLVAFTEAVGNDIWRGSIGRMAFVVGMTAFAGYLRRAFRPSGRIMTDIKASRSDGWLYRLRYVWVTLVVGTPLALVGLAIEGHYYTAIQLSTRLFGSLWCVMSLVVLHALAMRWVFTARGKLALLRAKERKEQKQEVVESEAGPIAFDPNQVDLATVNSHTRNLMGCAMASMLVFSLWWQWGDSLNAVGFVTDYPLWTTKVEKTVSEKNADGKVVVRTEDAVVDVTPGHLVLSLAVLSLAFLLANNLPGLLEIVLSHGLAKDAGARYALCTLFRYAITVTGAVCASNVIYVGWAQVQWLVAAMTVGLGFGLQEIFANFVSGLILLFERPIRLGDTVTVGDVTGTVTKLRIRSTTIVDGIRRELVVPNKEFITGKLINWTLSDRTSRVQIKVGLAYGTDPDQAMKLLVDVAKRHPDVMVEPAPGACFENFAESSMEMTLNAFVGNIDIAGRVKHELNTAIAKALAEAGISGAYPHREILIRGVEPSAMRVIEQVRKSA